MNVIDDYTSRTTTRNGDVGDNPSHGESSSHVTFLLHPLKGAGGEERQHQGEGSNEQAREQVNDRDLLEDNRRRAEGGKEGHVLASDLVCVVDKQIWESISKAPESSKHKPNEQTQPQR